jgi:hypothetical protein
MRCRTAAKADRAILDNRCRPPAAHSVQDEITVPKQSLQDSYERIEGPKRYIRAHGGAQQNLLGLSRQGRRGGRSWLVNVTIDVRKIGANCVAHETPGRGP